MKIEFDGPVSRANAATLSQVIEALLSRIQARDTGLDLSLLSRIIVTDQLAATEEQLCAYGSRLAQRANWRALVIDLKSSERYWVEQGCYWQERATA